MWHLAIYGPVSLFGQGLIRLLEESGYPGVKWINELNPDKPFQADETVDLVLIDGALQPAAEAIKSLLSRCPSAKVVLLIERAADFEAMQAALIGGARGCVDKTVSLAKMLSLIEAVLHGQVVYPPAVSDWLIPELSDWLSHGKGGIESEQPRQRLRPDRTAWCDSSAQGVAALVPHMGEATSASQSLPRADTEREKPVSNLRDASLPDMSPSELGTKTAGPAATSVSLSGREAEVLEFLTMGAANKVIARRLNISEATVKSHLKSLLRKLNFNNRTQAAIWAINQTNYSLPERGAESNTHLTMWNARSKIA